VTQGVRKIIAGFGPAARQALILASALLVFAVAKAGPRPSGQ
jgi:hypothetical protein